MKYEIKKLLFRREIWIVFGLSIIAFIILNLRQPWAGISTIHSAHRKTAEYYSLSLDESQSRIVKELEESENESDLNVLEAMQNSVKNYKVRDENMKQLLADMYHEKDHASTDFERRDLELAISRYNRKLNYRLCDSKQLHIAFLTMNDFGWLHYLYLLILCTLLAPLFAVESESGMYQILFISTKGKKQLFRNKIFSGIFCSALFAAFYTFLTFAIFWIRFGLSFQLLFAPIQSAEYYQNCPFSLNILEFLILNILVRILAGVLLTSITAVISSLFSRTAIVFGATAGVSGAFIILSRMLTTPDAMLFVKRLGLFNITLLGSYLRAYETVNVCGYPVEQIWLTIAFTCSVVLVLMSAAYIMYTLPNKEKRKMVKLCSVSKN